MSWKDILEEIQNTPAQGTAGGPTDIVRRKYLRALADFTKRPVIAYATAFLEAASPKQSSDISIHPGDKAGFAEITRDLPAGALDVILHSPGGSMEAAEAIVQLLRAKFTDIRFIVPIAAKSAGTMLALSGNSLVLDSTSELGPIDPQRQWVRRVGPTTEPVSAPVWAIQQEWDLIDKEIKADPSSINKWYPIITQFGPSLLIECATAVALSQKLVQSWLETYMFANEPDPTAAAKPVAESLADHSKWMSHSRAVTIDQAIGMGLTVTDLRDPANSALSARVWAAWHAIDFSLGNTGLVKLFENSLGQSRLSIMQMVENRQANPNPAAATPQPAGAMNRAQRRAAGHHR